MHEKVKENAQEIARLLNEVSNKYNGTQVCNDANRIIRQNYRDKIYFTCELEGEYAGIYEMAVGEDSSRAVLTGLTNGLIPKVITTGTDGSLYTILKSDDVDGKLQQMLLWKLDSQGNIVLEKDITELVPEKSAPWSSRVLSSVSSPVLAICSSRSCTDCCSP